MFLKNCDKKSKVQQLATLFVQYGPLFDANFTVITLFLGSKSLLILTRCPGFSHQKKIAHGLQIYLQRTYNQVYTLISNRMKDFVVVNIQNAFLSNIFGDTFAFKG